MSSKFNLGMEDLAILAESIERDIKEIKMNLLVKFAQFEQLKENIEVEKKLMSKVTRNNQKDLIELNIGGEKVTTFKSTLCCVKGSFFEAMFSGRFQPGLVDINGRVVLDRPYKPFSIILKSFRSGKPLQLPDDDNERRTLIIELGYYGLQKHFAKDLKSGRFLKSTLLKASYQKQLNKWVKSKKDWVCIYRATVHGFGGATFRSMTHEKGPCYTIIKSSNDNIFGGWNAIGWLKVGSYQLNTQCFLFSLKHHIESKPFRMENTGPHRGTKNSVYQSGSYGPTFGGGHDLYICNNANTTRGSYTNLGHSYTLAGFTYGQANTKNHLASSYNFTVKEIEVYIQKK